MDERIDVGMISPYKALEEAENKAIKKNAGLKKGITACLVMNGILLAAVIVLALRGFGII